MARVTKTPPTPLLTLNRMAEFLTSRTGRTIAETTPYWWWKMQKAAKLPVEMPEPVQNHGQSPMFDAEQIAAWYENYLEAIGEPHNAINA